MNNSLIVLPSSPSLSFPECPDDVRFEFDGKYLNIVTRKSNEEKHQIIIVSQTEEVINNVVHTVLTSDFGETFYIVDNQFHREDDRPAITMRRWIVDFDKSKLHTLDTWCKIWMKNGLYHRAGDKPALIYKNGDLLWMVNGHFKRNPFTNASIYQPNSKSSKAICCDRKKHKWEWLEEEEIKEQIAQKLFDFKYENS